MAPRLLLWISMTSLFLNQMDIFYLHFTELSAILDKTDNTLFLKTLLSLDFENSPTSYLFGCSFTMFSNSLASN